MKSAVTISRWLLVGMLSLTTLLGCEDKQEKAENQANKANAYIAEQNQLRKDLYDTYNFLVPKDKVLSQSELTANISSGLWISYIPKCVNASERQTIQSKLARVVVLSEEIQKIMANEDVMYAGPSSDFEHVKQNARAMINELPNMVNCEDVAMKTPSKIPTPVGKMDDEGMSGDEDMDTEFPSLSSTDQMDEQDRKDIEDLYASINNRLMTLKQNYKINVTADKELSTLDYINAMNTETYSPLCIPQLDRLSATLTLSLISADVIEVRAKALPYTDNNPEIQEDLEHLNILSNNATTLHKFVKTLPDCQ